MSLLKEYDCYKPVYPEDVFANRKEEFLRVLDTRLQTAVLYHEASRKTTEIHLGKFPEVSINECRDEYPDVFRLFREYTRSSSGEWLRIDSNLALIYMRTMAEFAASNNEDLMVGTSNHKDMQRVINPGQFELKEEYNGVEVILDKCLPYPKNNVKLETILKFKCEHRDDLVKLWQEIALLERGITISRSYAEISQEVYNFEKRIEETQQKAKELYGGFGIPYILGSARTVIAFVGKATIDTMCGNLDFSNPEAIVSGVGGLLLDGAVAVVPRIISRNKEISTIQKSNFAYVLNASKSRIFEQSKTDS